MHNIINVFPREIEWCRFLSFDLFTFDPFTFDVFCVLFELFLECENEFGFELEFELEIMNFCLSVK